MRDLNIPDLAFPMVEYGKIEKPWDLRPLLYMGGAKANSRKVFDLIKSGNLGYPITERIELVRRIHETLIAKLIAGGSETTVGVYIKSLRNFFGWADQSNDRPLTLESVEKTYRHWTDALLNSVRLKTLSPSSAYSIALASSNVISEVLECTSIIRTTRVRWRKHGARAAGNMEADKQNLGATFSFGHLLLDIIDGLSEDAMWGPLPVLIRLRTGAILEEWSNLRNPKRLAVFQPGYKDKASIEKVIALRSAWENDRTLRTRHSLANLRIEAELLVFIVQTGINHAQAHQLKVCQFSYKSTIDGYEVRDYKHRRSGEVLFEIYSEYKPVFEDYLVWCKNIFPDSDELFPFVRSGGRAASKPPSLDAVKKICSATGIAFIGPSKLRKTRVNWLLRQSRDPDLTADLAQHTKKTLLRVYEQPSQQVAMMEIIQFWPDLDPSLGINPQPCPAPGVCDGSPFPISDLPAEAPNPDCSHPSGCLFCSHHRDIDNEDYIWSVASMRHLKTIVLHGFRPPMKRKTDSARHVELAIEVLTAKLKWFKNSNALRRTWAEEAIIRIDESDFHPHWRYLIESAEEV